MVVLKKIKAGSLVEALTASVIIILVFMIASYSFNNVINNTIKSDGRLLNTKLQEIIYFTQNEELDLPYHEEGAYWRISAIKDEEKVILEIKNTRRNREFQLVITSD